MKCPNCGIETTGAFCSGCGTRIDGEQNIPSAAPPAKSKKPSRTVGCLTVIITFIVVFSLLMSLGGDDEPSTPADNQLTQEEISQMVDLKVEAQDMFNSEGKQKVVVWFTNTSDKVFDGQVSVDSIDVDGKRLGHDLVFIENLKPGENTYAILWLKTSYSPSFETRTSGDFK